MHDYRNITCDYFYCRGIHFEAWGYKNLLKQRDKNYGRRMKKEEKKVQKVKNEPHVNSSSAELSKRVENIKKSIQEKGIKREPLPLESGKEETSLLDSGNTETTMLSTGEEETSLLDVDQAPTGELGEAETTALVATDDDETGFLGTNNGCGFLQDKRK